MEKQGYIVPEATLRLIIQMLSATDLPVKQIALRTLCSQKIVVSVNRRFRIRVLSLRRDDREESA